MPFSAELRVKNMERAINPLYSRGLLSDAMMHLRNGNLATVAAILFDYASATMSFERLARKFNVPSKSLRYMLGPRGKPPLESLFLVLKALEEYEGLREHQAKTQ